MRIQAFEFMDLPQTPRFLRDSVVESLGSAHAANLFSHSAKLVWQSGLDAVNSFTLPGTRHSKSFCKLCGSALPSTQIAGLLVVPAECLDTEISMLPTAHLFLSNEVSWDGGAGEVPRFKGLPE